jgi:class 3 adenylate cyclase/DNA-binding SARP family transcriptional activator
MMEETANPALQHSLKAILFADAAGYTRLVVENEALTLDLMRRCFRVLRGLAAQHRGELIKTTGDGAVLAFDSVLSAVGCAVDAQDQFARTSQSFPEGLKAKFRVGIHLGEVTYEGGDIYGHSVNIAARLQTLAPPGGIYVSDIVSRQLQGSDRWICRNLGPKRLKNIAEPVNVYEIQRAEDRRQAQTSGQRLSMFLCRGFLIGTGSSPYPGISSRRARALLGYLALKQGNFEFRDRLASLLWSQLPIEQSRAELETCLAAIHRSFAQTNGDFISHDDDVIRLNQSRIQTDVDSLLDEIAHGQVSDELVDGDVVPEHLLDGLEHVDDAFASWLRIARHNWRNKLTSLLEANLSVVDGPGQTDTRSAQALRAIDPTHEPACRCLMQAEARKGNISGAARLYADLKARLHQEYGLAPSTETETLFEGIQSQRSPTRVAVGPPRPSLARLPRIQIRNFSLGGDDQSLGYLMTGLRAELIDSLVRFREWIVVDDAPQTSAHDGSTSTAESTRVDYVVQALCEKGHNGFSLKLTLSQADTRRYLWSEAYDVTIAVWPRTRGEIVRQIAARLGIYISTGRVMNNTGGNDASLAAYDRWLKGEHLLSLWQPDAEQEAERLFETVIDEMPEFAPAYASLADIYNVAHLVRIGVPRDPLNEARAAELARQAVSIDPLSAKAHLALAWSLTMAGQYEQAELHFDMATDLNPYDPATLISSAQGMAFVDRCAVAKTTAQQATQLTPLLSGYQYAYLATTRFLCGDLEACLKASRMAGTAIVDVPVWKTAALQLMGKTDLARASAREMLQIIRKSWQGDPTTSDAGMIDMLVAGYPVRSTKAKSRLRTALFSALDSL